MYNVKMYSGQVSACFLQLNTQYELILAAECELLWMLGT